MRVTFVDGSEGEIVAAGALDIGTKDVWIFTSGGLDDVDRTIDFGYGDGSAFMDQGPLETYRGSAGTVEMWMPHPDIPAGCPYLVYRFGEWFAGVRTCQSELGPAERREWAGSLEGRVTDDGFLVLYASGPLQLQETGGHEGPSLILGGRSNWIAMTPGECAVRRPDDGEIRTMPDGTRVGFGRIGGPGSRVRNNWIVTWCEDGMMTLQVSNASRKFALTAARDLRMRRIMLAD
jgi:hypothetical protein